MNWLARLKKISTPPELEPTEPTEPGFVGFVAPDMAHTPKTGGNSPAANYPAPDSNRWCWPHSSAMNGAEIETFTARLTRFTDKGLRLDDADDLADKLVRRDRDLDDRRLCLECIHLAGQSGAAWHCKNWQRAGVALRAKDAQLATAFVLQLQRCEGFTIHV